MPPLDIVVPIRVKRVEKAALPSDDAGAHESGYAAGYEEGRLRALWEAERRRQKQEELIRSQMAKLQNLYREFETLLAENLPDLIYGALHRVFSNHPFTVEEIGLEVTTLLRDMEQASMIMLECSPMEAEELRSHLKESDAVPATSKWTLESNPALGRGEFLLKSDLGDVDGRHLSRMRQIRFALETTS